MKNFILERDEDPTGVSGTVVAEGTLFSDGSVALRWLGNRPSTVVRDGPTAAEDMEIVHGHGGKTRVTWIN